MDKQEYIIWSSRHDTSQAGIAHFCELNAGRYNKTPEEMKSLPLGELLSLMWNDTASWRLTAYEALKAPANGPHLVIADRAGEKPLSKPEMSCFVLNGEHLNEIFSVRQGLASTFYSDGSNIRCTDLFSYGEDHYLFREITSTKNLQSFVQRVKRGEVFTESELDQFSRSIAPEIHKIYGWPEPGQRPLETVLSDAVSRAEHKSAVPKKEPEYSK